MTTPLINQTREFMYKQARLLECQLFRALFEDGAREPVLAALRAYQNSDGGFGNALEPDLRTPASQPLAVERAFFVLDAINAFDDPMVLKACDWLDEHSTADGGVPFALPTLEGYPHSPWMQADNKAAQLNPTASLCTYLMKQQQSDGGWPINWVALSPAAEAEWRGARTIDALNTLKAYGVL